MTATNNDDQLGEIYPTMLNELNSTSGVSFHFFIAVAILLWPSRTWFVAVMVCGCRGIGQTWVTYFSDSQSTPTSETCCTVKTAFEFRNKFALKTCIHLTLHTSAYNAWSIAIHSYETMCTKWSSNASVYIDSSSAVVKTKPSWEWRSWRSVCGLVCLSEMRRVKVTLLCRLPAACSHITTHHVNYAAWHCV